MNIFKKADEERKTVWERLAFALTFVYILFVLWGQYALFESVFPPFLIALAIIALSAAAAKLLLKIFGSLHITAERKAPEELKKEMKKLGAITFLTSLILLGIGYYSRFPGIYFMDSVYQLNECLTGVYDDWHPLLQTLLTFYLPVKLGGLWLVELLQILFYCGALTYMICSLYFFGCPRKLCILALVYLMLQPSTSYILLFPMKDCSFTILTMLLITEYLHIICTKGEWIKRNLNLAFLVVTLVTGTIIRHNAILFTLPLLIGVLVFSRKCAKRCIILVLSAVLAFLLIKIPFYKAFNMSENENRVIETMGLCFAVMGNVLIDCPEILSDEVKDFLYSVQSEELWELDYRLGDWNYVKAADGGADFDLIEETGRKKILEYTADTMLRAPDQTLRAFFAVTGMVWQTDGDMHWSRPMNGYDTNYKGSVYDDTAATKLLGKYPDSLPGGEYIAEIFETYRDAVEDGALKYVFCYVGLLNLLMLASCLSKIKKTSDIKRLLHILPVFAYSFGTALLLSGYDWRFFYYTYGCFFVIMFILLGKTDEEKNLPEQ